jgi:hypothetical protein
VAKRLQRQTVAVMTGKEGVGDNHRSRRRDRADDDVPATTQERQRVQGGGRRDDGDRARRTIDREQAEHRNAGQRKRERRRTPTQNQNRRCGNGKSECERPMRRVCADGGTHNRDRTDEEKNTSVDQP